MRYVQGDLVVVSQEYIRNLGINYVADYIATFIRYDDAGVWALVQVEKRGVMLEGCSY